MKKMKVKVVTKMRVETLCFCFKGHRRRLLWHTNFPYSSKQQVEQLDLSQFLIKEIKNHKINIFIIIDEVLGH